MCKYSLVDGAKNKEWAFHTCEDVVHPTDTSKLLIESCRSTINFPKKILDLGCGSGIVGIILAKLGRSGRSMRNFF